MREGKRTQSTHTADASRAGPTHAIRALTDGDAADAVARRIRFHAARRSDPPLLSARELEGVIVLNASEGDLGARGERARGKDGDAGGMARDARANGAMDGPSTRNHDRGGDLYDLADVRMAWKAPRRAGAGLANLGNTCFLNAVLQCLTHTPALAHFALGGEHKKFKTSSGGENSFNALYELGEHIVRALSSSGRTIAPIAFVKNLRALSKTFRKGRQEDAHEFVRCLLDAMHKRCVDFVRPKLKPNSPRSETTFLWKVFGGKLRSQVNCKTCGRNSETFDSFLDLSLDVVRCKSVLGAFKAFTVTEVLDGDNKYKCEGKSANSKPHFSKASKQFTVNEPPNVLALQLKRFAYVPFGRGKLSHFVEYPLELDITPYISEQRPNSSGDAVYELFAVLVHAGSSSNSGHYYCFVKAATGTWVEMDDEVVSPVSEKTVLKQQAYLLFYSRKNAPGTFEDVNSKMCRNIPDKKKVLAQKAAPAAAPTPAATRAAAAPKKTKRMKEAVVGVAPKRESSKKALLRSPSPPPLSLSSPAPVRLKSPSPKRARTPKNGGRPKIRSAFDAARRALLLRRLKHLGNGVGVTLEDLDLSMDSPVRTRSAKSSMNGDDAKTWLTKSSKSFASGWNDDDDDDDADERAPSSKKARDVQGLGEVKRVEKRVRREYDQLDEEYDRGRVAKHRRKRDKDKAPPLPKARGNRNPFQRSSRK